jgi:hypothetical protein
VAEVGNGDWRPLSARSPRSPHPEQGNENESRKKPMKTNEPNNKREESTYSLIVRSEEKKRILTEAVVYGLIILSAMAAIWEFGEELFSFIS